ncbi:MAG: hypothetical protein HC934_08685 [Acaryochloridaceae cyanobacterium SU_2_1]|nr:hypothetical protein [Acaryochloridaceae cyanobacterium SU_2_1]NJM95673.1 hypothetical protein [Acaryochloridaceae cyanobacterium CSU_5_19]
MIHLFTGCQQRAWQLAGWIMLPMTLISLLMVGLAWVLPATGSIPSLAQWVTPTTSWLPQYVTWLAAYTFLLRGQPFHALTFWLSLGGNLASLWLLYWGLKVFRPRRAVMATSCLTIWMLIWRLL